MRLILIGLFAAFSTAVAVIGLKPGTTALRNPPEEFMAMPWGASESEVRATLADTVQVAGAHWPRLGDCHDYPASDRGLYGDRFCVGGAALGGTKIETTYSFRRGGLASLRMIFSSDSFDRIEKIFIEQYGPPVSAFNEEVELSTKINRFLLWESEHIKIVLRRYLNSSTRGAATYTTAGEQAEVIRLVHELARRDAGKRP